MSDTQTRGFADDPALAGSGSAGCCGTQHPTAAPAAPPLRRGRGAVLRDARRRAGVGRLLRHRRQGRGGCLRRGLLRLTTTRGRLAA